MLNLYSVSIITDTFVKYYEVVGESTKEAVGDAKFFYYEEMGMDYDIIPSIVGTVSKLVNSDL